jgi:hypothetical protein
LLEKKVFPEEIQNVSDLVYSFTTKKDSKANKLKFLDLIQKNVRKKDKNIKSFAVDTTKFEDISNKYIDSLSEIHNNDF